MSPWGDKETDGGRERRDKPASPRPYALGPDMSFERNEYPVPKSSVVSLPHIASFARANALLEESALH
jgi:hypothetical protein